MVHLDAAIRRGVTQSKCGTTCRGYQGIVSRTLQGMTEGDYAEHGAGSLRFGYDEGPMFVLEVSRLRDVTFEEWADQDYEQQLAPQRKMNLVSEEHALQLWGWLARGEIDQVRAQPWGLAIAQTAVRERTSADEADAASGAPG